MSDKGRFDLEKSRFKQRFPNLPQEQFQYLLKKEKPELYKTAVREGWLKVTPDPAAQGGGKKPPSNNNKPTRNGGASPEEPKGNGGGQKQTTGNSPKPSTGETNSDLKRLYKDRKTTISKEDILGKGAKATEGAAKATSKEGLLGKFGQLGQKGAQLGQKIANIPIVRGTGRIAGRLAAPLAIGYGIYDLGVTGANWNAAGSSPTSRFFDAIGNHKQAQIRREADAPYGSYTSNSVKEPTEAERTQMVNRYNAEQPQANMSEEDKLKMKLYGTTNVTGDSVPVDDEGILEDYTGSTGGAVGGDGAGTPPSQGLTEIGDSGNGGNNNNNNGGVSGGVPVGGSATYQPSGILPASPEYYADEAYLANLPFTPSEYTQQSLDNLSNGYVKQADIYEKLNRAQQAYNDAVAAQTDPRYQGGLIPVAGYNVNPVLLARAQSADEVGQLFNTMYGENNQIGAVKNVLDNAQTNYEVGIANQAGVPYKNYEDAMLKRREQEITARAQDVKNQLEFQKQQTADLKEKRELAQKQYEVDNETFRELMKARLDHRAKMEELGMGYKQAVDTAMIGGQYGNQRADIEGRYGNQREKIAGQYGLRREQMEAQSNRDIALINNEAKALLEATKQGDSTAYINAVSNLGTMLSGMSPQMVEAFLYGNPTIREAMFGKGVTPEQAMIMLGRYQNSDNQGTGFWNWLRGNK